MNDEIGSWAAFVAYLAATRRGGRPLGEKGMSFPLAPGSPELVEARATKFPTGSRWLALSLFIAPFARLRIRPAFVANAELPMGGLAVSGEDVHLRQTLPFAGLGAATLEHTLGMLVSTAELLRAALTRAGKEGERPFGYLFR